ncbi:MAG: hypothetical protein HZA53_11525 [Planctomycetes bacterium]|nr:hypothetical protein [Planctomycetota bacterium]
MALLCTLHADGPATLKRLRQAGCATLEALERLDAERAAQILACTPASARRLQREARGLRERLHGEPLGETLSESAPPPAFDHEEPRAPLPSARAEIADSVLNPEIDAREMHSAAQPGESLAVELPAREKRLVQRVVDAWRQRDVEETASEAPEQEPESAAAPRLARSRPEERGEELAVVPAEELGAPLHAHDLDGLDAAFVAELASAGVRSMDQLATADAVTLARRLPTAGFTRLSRLIALARRALGPALEAVRAQRSAATPFPSADASKFSRSELPFALKRPALGLDLQDGLKTTPVVPPKDRPTRFEAEREGAGGPFV